MRRRAMTIMVAAPLALAAAPPAGALELDLDGAVTLALEQNPALRAFSERRTEVLGAIQEARSEAYPELSLVSSWTRLRNPSFLNTREFDQIGEIFPGVEFRPVPQELYGVALEVTQPLYTGGKVGAAVELARLAGEVTDEQIATVRLDTAFEAARAFYALASARQALARAEAQERLRRESLAVVEARYEMGEATRLELLRSRASLAEVAPLVAELEGAVEVAASRLRVVLGLDAAEPIVLTVANPVELPPVPGLDELVAAAGRQRPELVDLDLRRRAVDLQATISRAEERPQVELTGAYGREARLVDDLTDRLFDDWRVTFGLRWTFFDGGRRRGERVQLASQGRQLELERRDRALRVVLEVEQARAEYLAARARWGAARRSAEAAREASRVARETYEEGVALLVDWLDAQQRATEAEVLEVESFYDALTRRAQLARAVGEMPDG